MYEGIRGGTAIVTGGAQGIGKAICEQFIAAGASVVIVDTDKAHGDATVAELSSRGDCILVEADIADEAGVRRAVATAVETYGGVDFLVNNAAAFIMRGLDASPDDWRRMLEVNVMGYALCAKHAAPAMKPGGRGSIVNISSMSGMIAQPGLTTYSTCKAAVSHLTRMMAMELAPDIRVNAVCPGFVWSANNAAVIRRTMGLDRAGAEAHPEIGGKILLGRTADTTEIASVVLFLASRNASYITAGNLVVDGGYTAL